MRRLSRRSRYLIGKALLVGLYGVALWLSSAELEQIPVYALLVGIAPPGVWAAVWIVVGALTLVAAVSDHFIPWAFAAITGMFLMWGIGFAASPLLADVSPGRALLGGSLFSCLAFCTFVVSGWRDQ